MPYILKEDRKLFDKNIDSIIFVVTDPEYKEYEFKALESRMAIVNNCQTVGDVNYNFSGICWGYFGKNPRYSTADHIIDVLEALIQEGPYAGACVDSPLYRELKLLLSDLVGVEQETQRFRTHFKGTLRHVQLEFVRRKLNGYEDSKIRDPKNGDLKW